jgi:hypothetical protein
LLGVDDCQHNGTGVAAPNVMSCLGRLWMSCAWLCWGARTFYAECAGWVSRPQRRAQLFLCSWPGGGDAMYGADSDVISLTDANFHSEVTGSDDLWMVEFYAPW